MSHTEHLIRDSLIENNPQFEIDYSKYFLGTREYQ